jgi:deoxyribodipyrimidine photo-lyase
VKSKVPGLRIKKSNEAPIRPERRYILYWMIAARRPKWNFALQRAVEWAVELRKPLVVLEPLRVDYPWASARFHRFVLDGMAHQKEVFADTHVRYYPYVEPSKGAGKGLLAALSAEACAVVTDEFPGFMYPHMIGAASRRIDVRLEEVDGNGLFPLRAVARTFLTAYAFRRELQRELPKHLEERPASDPLRGVSLRGRPSLPMAVLDRWPAATVSVLGGGLDTLPLDHSVPPVDYRGGAGAADKRLRKFLATRLSNYGQRQTNPEGDTTSRLSPYLHFGQVSSHRVLHSLIRGEKWTSDRLGNHASGKRAGWWGMSAGAEAFLDQLVTWRELGYNQSSKRNDYRDFQSLPPWAIETLTAHARDPREYVYSLEQLETARTHDRLWNAAQTQLCREGHIHTYLRMLWGKKILEWTARPEQALEFMIALNDKYAVDGRDPNSYSGISWVLGRYDRPWGPERPVFGKVRYMSSENTARKMSIQNYLRRFSP